MYANEFAALWFKFSREMKVHLDDKLAPGLTEGQLIVLDYLFSCMPERVKPSDLIQYLSTTPAAITTLLDRMERNGLIVRERDEQDRRVVWIRITEVGQAEGEAGIAIRNEFIQTYLNRISEHNQKLFMYLMNKVFTE